MPARCGRPAPPRLVRLTLAASHLQFFWGVTPRLSRNESSPVPVANSREARFPPKESTSSDPRSEANDPHMDYVCIGARNLLFKFGRWRSENYEVRVSPSFARTDSYEIVDALGVADPAANAQPFLEVASWKLLSRFLEPRFHPLETAFHRDNFQDIKFRLAQLRLTPRLWLCSEWRGSI